MEAGAKDKLDLLFKLANLNQDEFRETLEAAIKDGFVSRPEFERFVHVMSERLDSQERVSTERSDAQDELLKLKVENVELKLKAEQHAGFDRYVEEKLPAAIAQHHKDQRSDLVNFVRARAMMIVAIILTLTTMVSLYAAVKNAAEVRDLKNIAKVANDLNDALHP